MERGFSILSIDAICASVQNGITPPMMREYRPMAAPFAERRVAEPPTHVSFGRRIVRSDGNAQKSLTAPEKRAPAECHKRGDCVEKLPFGDARFSGRPTSAAFKKSAGGPANLSIGQRAASSTGLRWC